MHRGLCLAFVATMLSAGVFAVDGTYVSDESSNWNSGGRWWQYGRAVQVARAGGWALALGAPREGVGALLLRRDHHDNALTP